MDRKLDQLRIGQSGLIKSVAGDGPLTQRLLAVGLMPGVAVTVNRLAPLGDPISVNFGCCQLSLRRREASAVTLEGE